MPGNHYDRFPLVWITGAAGLIGNYLVGTAAQFARQWSARPLARSDLDLADYQIVTALFRHEQPAAIIHCAALSKSTDCQTNPALAKKLNVEVTQLLCELAHDLPFIFFSSDLVFDGRTGNYDESSPVNPLSVYAETKVEGEQLVLSNPRNIVIRTSLNGGTSLTGGRSF